MPVDPKDWEAFLRNFPAAHILQSAAWGEVKSRAGWFPVRFVRAGCGAQVLFRRLPGGWTIAYIPKGPVGRINPEFWNEVESTCRAYRAIFLQIEPDLWQEDGDDLRTWLDAHARPSRPIQPRQTILLDISDGEDAILARMKQKTRYNIHLAEKKDIIIRPWDDLPAFARMMRVTSERDGFGVHSEAYYRQVYQQFVPDGQGVLLAAFFEEKPLAAVFILGAGERAWYFYGASTNEERNRMPTYLLQWEAIRWAARHGCKSYDLWGIPDAPEEQLEGQFTDRSDGLWGVYRFKRGFGGQIRRSAGGWDVVYSQPLYRLYQWYIARRRTEDAG